ncbi:UNKNOWN [Stylonychia lemnae]|uniref:Uncharacterized protein n=1 Tax=Stylonychia lemnae TaxID=5949 RepID=A0A078A1M7_STYLE|nr:UNKNOWN [Stylonychia lemnae]|eukprot:CDW75358.1 UNKNOWN [Stylonychia lemnae]
MMMNQLFKKAYMLQMIRPNQTNMRVFNLLNNQQSMLYSQYLQQQTLMNEIMINNQVVDEILESNEDQQVQYDCKKNKTTTQARKKRERRKTGKAMSIRWK